MGQLADIAVWLQTRIQTRRIAMLYLLLLIALLMSNHPASVQHILQGGLMLASLLIVFRLWDDIADRLYDQTQHTASSQPRVIVTTQHIRAFRILLAGLGLATAFAVYRWYSAADFFILLCLCLCLSILYYGKPFNSISRHYRELLLLLKYPLFIFLLSDDFNLLTIFSAAAVYGALFVHFTTERRQAPSNCTQ